MQAPVILLELQLPASIASRRALSQPASNVLVSLTGCQLGSKSHKSHNLLFA